MAVTEALARGIPVLAGAAGALPDTLGTRRDGSRPGLLVPPDDAPALTCGAAPLVRRRRACAYRLRRPPGERRGHTAPDGRTRRARCTRCSERLRDRAGRRRRVTRARGLRPRLAGAARTRRRAPPAPTSLLDALRPALPTRRWWCTTSAPAPARWPAGWPPGCPARSAGCCTTTTPRCWRRPAAAAPGCGTPTAGRSRSRPGSPTSTRLGAADLDRRRRWSPRRRCWTCSPQPEVDALAAACAGAGCPALLTLSVAGEVELDPPDDAATRAFAAAFDAHQRRRAGPAAARPGRRRPPPSPRSAGTGCRCGSPPARGGSARTGPTCWRSGCAAGWPPRWSRTRHWPAWPARTWPVGSTGGLRAVVQHRDLLALPPLHRRPEPGMTARRGPDATDAAVDAGAGGRGCGWPPCSRSWSRWSRCSAPRRSSPGCACSTPAAVLAALGHRPGHHRAERAALAAGGAPGRAAAAARRRHRRDLPGDLPERGAARRGARRRRPGGPARAQQRRRRPRGAGGGDRAHRRAAGADRRGAGGRSRPSRRWCWRSSSGPAGPRCSGSALAGAAGRAGAVLVLARPPAVGQHRPAAPGARRDRGRRAHRGAVPQPPGRCCWGCRPPRWPATWCCSWSPPARPGPPRRSLALLPPLLLALIAMGLPISVGGWGPREGVAALAFWMAGLGAPLGVTTSVAYGALALIASLPGGVVLLARRFGRTRPAAEPLAEPVDDGLDDRSAPCCRCRRSGSPGTGSRRTGRRGLLTPTRRPAPQRRPAAGPAAPDPAPRPRLSGAATGARLG